MDGYRCRLLLVITTGLFGLSGAQCPNMVRQYVSPAPRVLPPSPTLEQVVQVVNGNSGRIESFSAPEARLSVPGFPAIRANVAFERPRRLRLLGDTAMTGPEVDLGSNDELFWFWVKRNQPPGVYYCRHDQFAHSQARQMIPIEPDWLIEALGVVEFDPSLPHQGPFSLPGDRLEIRTIRETARGPVTKTTILDGAQGWVLEQHLHDAQGRLLASSVAAGHRRDPLTDLVMPSNVTIQCPAAQFSMRLDLGKVQINRPGAVVGEQWTMPNYNGAPLVNLCDPSQQPFQATRQPPAWR